MDEPHLAIGTSALAVAANALIGLANHARKRNVTWRCGGRSTPSWPGWIVVALNMLYGTAGELGWIQASPFLARSCRRFP